MSYFFLNIKLIIKKVIQIYSLGTLERMLEILGSNYQNTDKGLHLAPKVDAKNKRLVLQKSSQKIIFAPLLTG